MCEGASPAFVVGRSYDLGESLFPASSLYSFPLFITTASLSHQITIGKILGLFTHHWLMWVCTSQTDYPIGFVLALALVHWISDDVTR
jgi:hypothetical protein